MIGDSPTAYYYDDNVGYNLYRMKIKEELQVVGSPEDPCSHYQPGQYYECIEENNLEEFLSKFSCTPPWMTRNESLWCHSNCQVSKEMSNLQDLLFHKYLTQKSSTECYQPCRKLR